MFLNSLFLRSSDSDRAAAEGRRYIASCGVRVKLSRIILIALLFLIPHAICAQRKVSAKDAWNPFFTAFRTAVRNRDRAELRKMMSSDFFSSGGNDSGAEAAFQFWDDPNVSGWEAFNKVLARGTVPMAAWWDAGGKRKYISRVGPPAANVRRNMKLQYVDWYAIFEFREGRWYCTIFNQCCD
jgi:hypothetical protein